MSSRNSRSNASPRASESRAISSAVSMPGISGAPGAWCACGPGTSLPARFEPPLHHLDFVGLRHLDAPGEQPHVVAAGPLGQQGRHLERLRVMSDHTLHEPDVGGRELHLREIGSFLGRNRARRLSGSAWLDDGRPAANLGRAARGAQEGQHKNR